MNQKYVEPDQRNTWQLDQVPDSSAPTLDSIHETITTRRRGRRLMIATCSIAFLVGSVSMAILGGGVGRRGNTGLNPNPLAVDLESSIASVPKPLMETDAKNPLPSSADAVGEIPELHDQPDAPPITLYANVQSLEPVFEFDTQLKKMVPVGWVQVSDSVPVDLDRFSSEEIQTFQTVLKGESFHTSL